jgi:hypothetical protein
MEMKKLQGLIEGLFGKLLPTIRGALEGMCGVANTRNLLFLLCHQKSGIMAHPGLMQNPASSPLD